MSNLLRDWEIPDEEATNFIRIDLDDVKNQCI